jgi:hypothetical protein
VLLMPPEIIGAATNPREVVRFPSARFIEKVPPLAITLPSRSCAHADVDHSQLGARVTRRETRNECFVI